jgi:epsilon-lactone hydrolase
MASKQSEAIKELYRSWLGIPAQHHDWSLDDQKDMVEGWNVLSTEPGGVDYIEVDAGGVPALWAVPKQAAGDRVLFAIHGGGFVGGSVWTHRKLFGHLAKAVGAKALLPSYRLLPEGTHPAPVEDCITAYRWLLDEGIQPHHIAPTGDSAGGGLSITTQVLARDKGLPLPAAALPFSPWFDFEVTGETMLTNRQADVYFTKESVEALAAGLLGDGDPRDPYLNPLHADLSGLGPIYLQVGGDELLLDDSRRLAEHARRAGVEVRLDVFPEMQHTFQMMVGHAPEAKDAVDRMATWVRPKLGLPERVATAAA